MSILSIIGEVLAGPIKDLTETRKATKQAKLEAAIKMVEAKARLEQAKVDAAAAMQMKQVDMEANWEQEAVRQAGTSWKDEYWTIVLSIPLILVFIAPLQAAVLRGFDALAQVPVWYQAAVMAALSFAFGLRALNKFTNWKGKNDG